MHEIRIRRSTAVALGALLGLAGTAFNASKAVADNPTATLNLTATVQEACTIDIIADINFGVYDGDAKSIFGAFKVNCSPASVDVRINNGQHPTGSRRMKNGGTGELPYTLWTEGSEWLSDIARSVSSNINIEVEGRISDGMNVPAGTYTDQVLITLVL
jgi:spore coat protein U-like protein